MFFVFAMLFLCVSVFHLFMCFINNVNLARFSKPFIIPTLALAAFFSRSNLNLIVYIALISGFFGDIFMMKKDLKTAVTLGILSFGIGHILYAIAIIENITIISPFATVSILLIYFIFTLLIFSKIKQSLPTNMRLPVILYTIVISSMSIAATLQLLDGYTFGRLLIFIGSILFIVSDSVIAFRIFRKDSRFSGFIIMLTYISAQAFIILGFILN